MYSNVVIKDKGKINLASYNYPSYQKVKFNYKIDEWL